MNYARAAWEQLKWDLRAVVLFVLAVIVFCGSGVTLIRGDGGWASFALFVGAGLFAMLCVYLIRIDVRRARAERDQSTGSTESG